MAIDISYIMCVIEKKSETLDDQNPFLTLGQHRSINTINAIPNLSQIAPTSPK